MDWANFGPKKLISPSGPGPIQKTRLGQDPPSLATKTSGGNYFPPTPACRTLFVLHAEKEKKIKRKNEGEEGLPGAEGAVRQWSVDFAGGAAVEAGGGVKRRCGSNDSSKRYYCLPRCSDVLPGSLMFFRFLTFPRGF